MRLEPQLTQDGTNLTQAQYGYLAGGIFTCCQPLPNLRNREILLVELANQIVPAKNTPYGKRRFAAGFPHNGRVDPFFGGLHQNLIDHAAQNLFSVLIGYTGIMPERRYLARYPAEFLQFLMGLQLCGLRLFDSDLYLLLELFLFFFNRFEFFGSIIVDSVMFATASLDKLLSFAHFKLDAFAFGFNPLKACPLVALSLLQRGL